MTALFRAAAAALGAGRLEEAAALYGRLLDLDPAHAPALHHFGLLRAHGGDRMAAIALLERAQAAAPRDAAILRDLAGLHQAEGDFAAAAEVYLRLLTLTPDEAAVRYRLGNALQHLGRSAEAVPLYEEAIRMQPGQWRFHGDLGLAFDSLGRPAAAVAAYRRALDLAPEEAVLWSNLGAALAKSGDVPQAIAACRRALALAPELAAVHFNLGAVLQAGGEPMAAGACYRRALALDPDHAEAAWNEALIRLTLGDYGAGWAGYELRYRQPQTGLDRPDLVAPRWTGAESLAGRTILLHAEQGLGDTIQFGRYVPLVARLGARVVLEVQPPLRPLFAGVDGVAHLLSRGEGLPLVDCHCPLPSLPLAFGTTLDTIPPPLPDWQHARRRAEGRHRIGLAWAGNPANSRDAIRSIPLELLLRGLKRPGIDLVSLQRELKPGDAALLGGIERPGELCADLGEMAAVIRELDLVIAVDTAVAHLAGALGKPVWILLAHAADWRWLHKRRDSPWYPSARLFRQPGPGDWAGALRPLSAALAGRPGLR